MFHVKHGARLDVYESLLRQRQRRTNLVSSASLPALWTRHFLDSAQLAPLLAADAAGQTVDVGSGAGFPRHGARDPGPRTPGRPG